MTEFDVPDMTCGHCKAAVEDAIRELEPSADVEVDLAARKVRVAGLPEPVVLGVLANAGYLATVAR